ncbi:hypothetical protein [Bradyrhizobium forestalis]|nr:hypothetical protein [Bradyrhizobium forestalis]
MIRKVGDLADKEHLFGQGNKANAIYDAACIPDRAGRIDRCRKA